MGLRDGTQVAVTAVVDKLHGVIRKIVDLIRQVILVGFAFIMIKAGGEPGLKAASSRPNHACDEASHVSDVFLAGYWPLDSSSSFRPLHWYSRLQNSETKEGNRT